MKHAKRPNRSWLVTSLVGCVALSYVVLSMMSAGCALVHTVGIQHHQHHSNKSSSTQNAFCAWACQATTDVAVAMGPPQAVTERMMWPDDVSISGLVPFSYPSALHSRAPPAIFFARLG